MIFCELDYRAIEAVLVGYFANDPEYIKAAKLGVHAILASHVLKTQGKFDAIDLRGPEDGIRLAVAEIKKRFPKEYDDAKHASHGSNYGGTPKKLMMDFPESFPSMKYAAWVQDLYFGTIARKVRAWQDAVIEKAFRDCYLDNVWGYRHYFFDALKFQKRGTQWERVWGTDAKKVLAFLPQSTAAGIIKEAMLRLPLWLLEGLRLQVHDSLLFEFDESKLDDRAIEAKAVMERPVLELGGLVIETDVAVGKSWGEMESWRRGSR